MFVPDQVDPVMHPLLERVLKARPADVASFLADDLLATKEQLRQQGPHNEAGWGELCSSTTIVLKYWPQG